MKRSLLTIALVVAILASTVATTFAFPLDPPDEPPESVNHEQCDLPGIVRNESSYVVRVFFDYDEHPWVFDSHDLQPGENSDDHGLIDNCDMDYLTVPSHKWNLAGVWMNPGQWSYYLGDNIWKCVDFNQYGQKVKCTKVGSSH